MKPRDAKEHDEQLRKEAAEIGISTEALKAIDEPLQKKQNAVMAIMQLVSDHKMTNDAREAFRVFRDHKDRCSADIGESEAERLLNEFLTEENQMRRLVMYKDRVNPSRRRGNVPLI